MKHWIVDDRRMVVIDDDGSLLDCHITTGGYTQGGREWSMTIISANPATKQQIEKAQELWRDSQPSSSLL